MSFADRLLMDDGAAHCQTASHCPGDDYMSCWHHAELLISVFMICNQALVAGANYHVYTYIQ